MTPSLRSDSLPKCSGITVQILRNVQCIIRLRRRLRSWTANRSPDILVLKELGAWRWLHFSREHSALRISALASLSSAGSVLGCGARWTSTACAGPPGPGTSIDDLEEGADLLSIHGLANLPLQLPKPAWFILEL